MQEVLDLPVNDRAASFNQGCSNFLQLETFHPVRKFIKTQEFSGGKDSDQKSCLQAV